MTVPEYNEITPEQMDAIEKIRSRFKNDMGPAMFKDTWLFYRFLKARDFNLSQAEIMLRKHLQWRKAKKVDTMLQDFKPLEVMIKHVPFNILGYDKEGSITLYIPLANMDVKGIHMASKPSDMDNFVIYSLENAEKLTKERNKNKNGNLPGYVLIYDMKDLPFSLATDKKGIEDMVRTAKTIQDNYPERLKCVIVINASSFFSLAFAILKKFLAPVTLKKIHLYGVNDPWKDHLRKLFDPEVLPAFLGGNKTDPDGDPYCKSTINFAGPVAECYFCKSKTTALSRDPKSKKLILPRASFTEIRLNIVTPGSLIEWEFETKSKDIAFGLYFIEKNGNEEKKTELVPLIRLDTECYSETGVYKCDKPGTYTMLFDNSYSWFRSKEIFYKAQVVSPKEHEAQLEH